MFDDVADDALDAGLERDMTRAQYPLNKDRWLDWLKSPVDQA